MSHGTNGFDPYLKWLEIPPGARPPDHYALLGLPHFESDTKRIEEAARERMKRVREYHIGPHSDQCQELLNDIAKAKVCLMQAKTKEPYDEQLRLSLLSGAANAASSTDTPPAPHSRPSPLPLATRLAPVQNGTASADALLPPLATSPTSVPNATASNGLVRIDTQGHNKANRTPVKRKGPVKRARASARPAWLRHQFAGWKSLPQKLPPVPRVSRARLIGLIAIASVLAVAVAVVAYRTWGPSPPEDGKQAKTTPNLGIPTPPGPSPSEERAQAETGGVPEPEAAPPPNPIPDDAPLPENLLDSVDAKRAGWTEVLPLVQVEKHRVAGEWETDGVDVVCSPGLTSRLALPLVVAGSYDVELVFTVNSGRAHVDLFLPIGDSATLLSLGADSGLWDVDRVPKRFTCELDLDRRYECRVEVRDLGEDASIGVFVNGKECESWQGPSSSLSVTPAWVWPSCEMLGIGGDDSQIAFHRVAVRAVSAPDVTPGVLRQVRGPQDVSGYEPVNGPPHLPASLRGRLESFAGNWYFLSEEGLPLVQAQLFARSVGGRLLQISSDEENQFLVEDLAAGFVWYEMPFLGLIRQGGSLNWLTDALEVRSPGVGFQRWAHDQPEFRGEAGIAVFPDGLWHDVGSDEPWRRVCVEWGPELPLAGLGQP